MDNAFIDELVDDEPAVEPAAPTHKGWDPHLGPFNPYQEVTPPGYDETKSPSDPGNVAALRTGFSLHANEPLIHVAIRAGQHFGMRLRSKRDFSAEHFRAALHGETATAQPRRKDS